MNKTTKYLASLLELRGLGTNIRLGPKLYAVNCGIKSPEMSIKWSTERTIKFLKIYEQHPCLWDVRKDSYKNREAREEAYQSIAKAMQLDDFGVMDVRSKIRTLRNAYTLELAKILKIKKAGVLTNETYRPKQAWFPVADRFFSQIIHIGESQSTESGTRWLCENTNDSCSEMKYSSQTSQYQQERKITADDSIDTIAPHSSRTSSNDQDNYDIFGSFIATELRELGNPGLVRSVKKQIQCAILDAYETQNCAPPYLPVDNYDLPPPEPSPTECIQTETKFIDDETMRSAIKCSIIAQSSIHTYKE